MEGYVNICVRIKIGMDDPVQKGFPNCIAFTVSYGSYELLTRCTHGIPREFTMQGLIQNR